MSHQWVTSESFLWFTANDNSSFWTLPIGQFRLFWLWNDLWLSYIDFHLSSFSNLTSGFTSGSIIFIISIISSAIKCRVVTAVNLMPFVSRASPVGEILFWFSSQFKTRGSLTVVPWPWSVMTPDSENLPYCRNIPWLTAYNQQAQKGPIVDLDYSLRQMPRK